MIKKLAWPLFWSLTIYFGLTLWLYSQLQDFGKLVSPLVTVAILALLEISISFDNAVVNATYLKKMSEVWQKRFLTWGILIAVFGMRLLFPIVIIAILAKINPWQALILALGEPEKYSTMMKSVHEEVNAFGGMFLLLVGIKYFFNSEKETHWIQWLEKPLSRLGRVESFEIGLSLVLLLVLTQFLPSHKALSVTVAGISGITTWVAVEVLGAFLDQGPTAQVGLGGFIYLEVLDASFSFDGVIGALALTNQLVLIVAGLGIGALFVRSFTLILMKGGALTELKFLEHGAFYAVAALATMMLGGIFVHLSEWIIGGVGLAILGASVLASLAHKEAPSSRS